MFASLWKLVPTQIYQPLIYKFQNLYSLEYKLECEEKPEEELIDLTTEATPWKKTEDKTLGGTSVQLANCNSPAQQQVKKEFSPEKLKVL